MNTDVVLRRDTNPPVLKLWDSRRAHDAGEDPLEFTRIWMGIVGPKGAEPGYACVVGELYDGDVRQKVRPKLLLDEAQAIAPADLREDQVETHRDLVYAERGGERIIKANDPTIDDLRQAAVALKDLYWYGRAADRLQIYTPPDEKRFTQYILATEGLCRAYPTTRAGRLHDPEHLRSWFPFFKDHECIAPLSPDVPFGEDPEYGLALIESLLARDELQINEHCTLFENRQLEAPHRAVALVCAAMQAIDWSYLIREWRESDGYEDIEEAEERDQRRREEAEENYNLRLYMAGLPMPPPPPDRTRGREEADIWERLRH